MSNPAAAPGRSWLGIAFACLFAGAFLTLWVPSRWALAAVQVGISLLGLAWLAAVAPSGMAFRWHPLLVLLAAAPAWGWLQILAGQTVYRWATEQAALDWFFRLAACFLAFQLFQEELLRRRVLGWLLWFGFALSVTASLQRFTAPGKVFWLFESGVEGAMGPFVYYNQYAAFLETVLPLALVGALEDRGRAWVYWLMAAVMLASVVAAGSRAGAFVLVAETLAVFALWKRRSGAPWRSVAWAAAATALLAVLFVATMGWTTLWQKLQRADPWGERRHLALSSIQMALDRPWMGAGLGTWPVAYPAYARFDDGLFDNQAHNDWAQWAAEGGLPFLLLMAGVAALLVRPALRSVWGVGLAAVLLHCLVDYHFQQRPAFGYYYFALAGIAVAQTEKLSRRGKARNRPE